MMVMDVAIFHKTEDILDLLKSNNILPAMIPPGLKSLLQPLDTAINGPFKKQLQIQSEAYLDRLEETGGIPDKWTIRHRREMVTVVVAEAWEAVAANDGFIQKAFLNCGILIHPDGSQDHLISIKDINSSRIKPSNWRGVASFDTFLEEYAVVGQKGDLSEAWVSIKEELSISRLARLRKSELQQECGNRGLATSSNKSDLLVRLREVIDDLVGQQEEKLAEEEIVDCIFVSGTPDAEELEPEAFDILE
jgi:hypothetical protein